MATCKLALIQMDCKLLLVDENVQKAINLVETACDQGAEFICLPEAFNTGYYNNSLDALTKLAEPIDGKTITRFRKLAKSRGVHIVAPIILQVSNKCIQNVSVLIDDNGEVIGTYAKTHLVGDEPKYFKRGNNYPVWDTKFGKVGMLICYDVCFPEPCRILALRGAELVVVPSAWRASYYFVSWWNQNIACHALDNLYYIAGVNRTGLSGEEKFAGSSQIANPIGEVLVACSVDEENIIYETIDLGRVKGDREFNTVLIDRHPEDYALLSNQFNKEEI